MAQSRENLKDEEIVQIVLEGDTESYGILFERYYALAFRLALMNLGEDEMAQDITQEAFLRAYKILDRLRDASSFAAWIVGIARNLCRNAGRSKASQVVTLDYLSEAGIEPPDPGNPLPFQNEQREERNIKKNLFWLCALKGMEVVTFFRLIGYYGGKIQGI
ncbi:sigma-70 family RNA polymerase sigma factor [Candidatus Sumerlaeota bacterium]|nr:sigma-70 family RNA polymerase sigma factor [Candidatus Sumerlaeota bacterium]